MENLILIGIEEPLQKQIKQTLRVQGVNVTTFRSLEGLLTQKTIENNTEILIILDNTKKLKLSKIENVKTKFNKPKLFYLFFNKDASQDNLDTLILNGEYFIEEIYPESVEDEKLKSKLVSLTMGRADYSDVKYLISDKQRQIDREEVKVIKERKIEISREVIKGQIKIAITNTKRLCGSTNLSILLSNYLASRGFKVALVDLTSKNDFKLIVNKFENAKVYNNSSFNYYNVDYYYECDLHHIYAKGYDYIILDMPIYNSEKFKEFKNEFLSSNERILLSRSKVYETQNLEEILKDIIDREGDLYQFKYCFNFTDEYVFTSLIKDMTMEDIYQVPYNPNPYNVTDIDIKFLSNLLADVLPAEISKVRNPKNNNSKLNSLNKLNPKNIISKLKR